MSPSRSPSRPPLAASLSSLQRDERGLSTVEYIILLVLIAIVGMAAWKAFGELIARKTGGSTDRVYQMGREELR